MRQEDVRILRCLYTNKFSNVTVYQAELIARGQSIIIKELLFSSLGDASEAVEEALKQTRLNAHPNVATMYGASLNQRNDQYIVCLAIERLETDLFQETERRANAHTPWTEQQLWDLLYPVIDALDYSQSLGLCHRDIKPQNLFLGSDGTIKVGDFGSARLCTSQVQISTIKGSPYFLSPILKAAYLQSMGRTDLQVQHNAFKSDVYSLGLTWLYMAKLRVSEGLA